MQQKARIWRTGLLKLNSLAKAKTLVLLISRLSIEQSVFLAKPA